MGMSGSDNFFFFFLLIIITSVFIYFISFLSILLVIIRSSHSPESGVGSHASHTSLPDSEVERLYANAEAEIDAEEDDTLNGSEAYDNEALPILGTCRALYAFEG